ncbi:MULTISPECIES: hypothetical protein [Paenibacillus]|uniref:Uncharacterized protein n=1 Tax=Paenibacillus naphthalenovorans TaxID=162209 RepID=A0A0U2U900_9BACL|nr:MULTISPECIES: hypothetical protein [Paenibacillus]ALS22680.1 hypothetical protein IJ22_23060 [Paenibacillus naphthalenovorans]NTZ17708.1 hypothetical protein [Paenibacillus sp. JMULE4]GCL70476.1 hypothetical protein PN4B1_03770 [Paenibacillus naphthalenovorans]SDH81067.1 hypothetical protein SAMN05421868_101186 [Paenibacillus naphthalenovorans]
MKWIPRLLLMTAVSVAVAAGLSYLSKLDATVSVFRSVQAQPVSEANIVDVVSKMQLHQRIRRVELNHAIVSIDLLSVKSTEKADIFEDLYEIPKVMFGSSTNIYQVLIRVLDGSQEGSGSPGLLVAADARREKWLANESGLRPQNANELQQFLDAHYRMTYAPKWKARFLEKS